MCVDTLLKANRIVPPVIEISVTGKNASQPKANAITGEHIIIANPRFDNFQMERICQKNRRVLHHVGYARRGGI
jgi:hypothetical protein